MKPLAFVAMVVLAAGCSHNEPAPWPRPSTPPQPPECGDTITAVLDRKVIAHGAQSPELQGAITKACVDDGWSARVRRCWGDAMTSEDLTDCDRDLSPEQSANLHALIGTAGNGPMPPECKDYKAMMDRLASCPQMPKVTQDAMRDAYDQMRAGWDHAAALPVDARAAMAAGCKAGADALQQGGVQLCGW